MEEKIGTSRSNVSFSVHRPYVAQSHELMVFIYCYSDISLVLFVAVHGEIDLRVGCLMFIEQISSHFHFDTSPLLRLRKYVYPSPCTLSRGFYSDSLSAQNRWKMRTAQMGGGGRSHRRFVLLAVPLILCFVRSLCSQCSCLINTCTPRSNESQSKTPGLGR